MDLTKFEHISDNYSLWYQTLITALIIFCIVEHSSYFYIWLLQPIDFQLGLCWENFQVILVPSIHFLQRMCAFFVKYDTEQDPAEKRCLDQESSLHHRKQMSLQMSLVFIAFHHTLDKPTCTFSIKTSPKHILRRIFWRLLKVSWPMWFIFASSHYLRHVTIYFKN